MSESEAMKAIRKASSQSQLLTREEERDLFLRLQNGDKHAEDLLVRGNIRLVLDQVRRYHTPGACKEDLVQEGMQGLLRAIRKFDVGRGNKFSTLGTWWIRQALSRFILGPVKTIRLPDYLGSSINQITRARSDLERFLGRAPTDREVASHLHLTPNQVRSRSLLAPRTASLDSEEGKIAKSIPSSTPDTEYLVANRDEMRGVYTTMSECLTDREAHILRRRYGIGSDPAILETVAGEIGVTRERVRQIQNKALSVLRRELLHRGYQRESL